MNKIIFDLQNEIRLDLYLSQKLKVSRAKIAKLISSDLIKVNEKTPKKSQILVNNDIIEYTLPKVQATTVIAQDIPINIVYEDEFLAIIDKHSGICVHPAPGNPDNTLLNAVMHKLNGKLSSFNPERPGLVHRLDKETSGLVIVAKDDDTHLKLSKMFAERKIKKTYTAVVCGLPKPIQGTIDAPIARSKTDRKKMTVATSNGRRSITHYKVTGIFDFFSVVQINLETGRTHQIRVHFSHINHPVLGDKTYNSQKRTNQFLPVNCEKKLASLLANKLKRQALHASRLSFIHPQTNKLLSVASKLPLDIKNTIKWLKQNFYVR